MERTRAAARVTNEGGTGHRPLPFWGMTGMTIDNAWTEVQRTEEFRHELLRLQRQQLEVSRGTRTAVVILACITSFVFAMQLLLSLVF
jgi:hypothetical protein